MHLRQWAIATAGPADPGLLRWSTHLHYEAGECEGHEGERVYRVLHEEKLSDRQFCMKCGGHLMTGHPPLGLIDVYAAIVPTLTFTPGVHVNYAETVLRMTDGLPKLKDFPVEFGGFGEVVPE